MVVDEPPTVALMGFPWSLPPCSEPRGEEKPFAGSDGGQALA